MTRKIERELVAAVLNGSNYRNANTRVEHANDRAYVYLHGLNIAQVFDDYLLINNCGYQTAVTKSRLNALLRGLTKDTGIYQKAYVWHLAGPEGDTEINPKEWYKVSSPVF